MSAKAGGRGGTGPAGSAGAAGADGGGRGSGATPDSDAGEPVAHGRGVADDGATRPGGRDASGDVPTGTDEGAGVDAGAAGPDGDEGGRDGAGDGAGSTGGGRSWRLRRGPGARGAAGAPRTRRFPLFTRDTARPEGGGRAAGGGAPAPARQWPLLAVLVTAGAGLLLTALDVFRVGLVLVGVGLLAGAVLRWLMPSVGMLAVRSRFTDIVTYGVLGVVIVLLALMAQPGPWLEIPFLDDTLHFTITDPGR